MGVCIYGSNCYCYVIRICIKEFSVGIADNDGKKSK